MKTKILLVLFVFITHYTSCFAQSGSDFIITIDNSSSIQQQDYDDISENVKKLAHQILECNPENRVSVVHYGTALLNSNYTGNESPKIYIESDFTNNLIIAQNFIRRLNFGDHFHEAVGLIGNALDNISNSNILSPQQSLSHNPDVPLVIISFTDAERASGSLPGGSYLVNFFNPTFNSQFAFQNFTDFKNNRDVRFVMIHRSPDNASTLAAAVIASNGGSYFGNLENYSGNPEHGYTPKFYYQQSDFVYQQSVGDQILQNFCKFEGYVKFFYEKAQACTTPSAPQYNPIFNGKFSLPAGATFLYMKLFAVNTVTNAEIPVNFNPTIIGNTFYYPIQPNDINPVPTSGEFRFRIDVFFDYGGNVNTVSGWNNYPISWYGGSDVLFGSCRTSQIIKDHVTIENTSIKIERNADPNNLKQTFFPANNIIIKLFPNPTDGIFNITLDRDTSGRLDIIDINGVNIHTEFFKNKKTFDLDINSRIKGIYIIKITNYKGEIFTKKVLKN